MKKSCQIKLLWSKLCVYVREGGSLIQFAVSVIAIHNNTRNQCYSEGHQRQQREMKPNHPDLMSSDVIRDFIWFVGKSSHNSSHHLVKQRGNWRIIHTENLIDSARLFCRIKITSCYRNLEKNREDNWSIRIIIMVQEIKRTKRKGRRTEIKRGW